MVPSQAETLAAYVVTGYAHNVCSGELLRTAQTAANPLKHHANASHIRMVPVIMGATCAAASLSVPYLFRCAGETVRASQQALDLDTLGRVVARNLRHKLVIRHFLDFVDENTVVQQPI